MNYTFQIFRAASIYNISNNDEHISTVCMTKFDVARLVDTYNKDNDGYFYFIRM